MNTKFSDACDFEQSDVCKMMSLFGFKLFHGCVVDPKQQKLHKLIGNKSSSEAMEFLLSNADPNASDEERKQHEENKEIVRRFLDKVWSRHILSLFCYQRMKSIYTVTNPSNSLWIKEIA